MEKITQNGETVAYARILDALSWFIKGAVQLRVCNHPEAQRIASAIESLTIELWQHRGGAPDGK